MENAILAQEVVHFMENLRAKNGSLAMKIDLEKAYDKLEWDFLEDTLRDFNFPTVIINLVMCCVRSSSVSILWNGERLPSCKTDRGLRQGDPLSPYLFVLCMEKLSIWIQRAVEEKNWIPISISRGGPTLSHILFADDVLLFCKAKDSQLRYIAQIMDSFGRSFGLIVNVQKSKVVCSKGVYRGERRCLAAVNLIPIVSNLGSYLGFPLHVGRATHTHFNFLLDQINRRLAVGKIDY